MAKQRTRKQKVKARHSYACVKGQKNIGYRTQNLSSNKAKSADLLAQETQIHSLKRNLIKSLILVSLILCLELVVYSLWNVK